MVADARRRVAPARRARWVALGALAPILLVAAFWRAASEHVPPLALHRTLPQQLRIPGRAPTIAWPREGEAAVEVEGVGSFGVHGRRTPVPIASVAKVMTAYLTLQEHPLSAGAPGFMLTVTHAEVAEERRRAADDQSIVPVRAGERVSERKALQALLLPSANNVAAMLARHDAGGIPAFVARMNATARELHMTSTRYTDPSGFEHTTVSTAADQLQLARVAMRIPALAGIVAMSTAKLPVAGRVANINGLLDDDGYVGVKTGSDTSAGGCLMFAKHLTVAGRPIAILGVVLGQRRGPLIPAALSSARRLGNSAAAAVGPRTALPAGSTVLAVRSVDGQHLAAVTTRSVREIGWPGLRLAVQMQARHPHLPLAAGRTLASVTLPGGATVTAVASKPLSGPSLIWRFEHLL